MWFPEMSAICRRERNRLCCLFKRMNKEFFDGFFGGFFSYFKYFTFFFKKFKNYSTGSYTYSLSEKWKFEENKNFQIVVYDRNWKNAKTISNGIQQETWLLYNRIKKNYTIKIIYYTLTVYILYTEIKESNELFRVWKKLHYWKNNQWNKEKTYNI